MTLPPKRSIWSPFGVHYAWLIAAMALVTNLGAGVLSPNVYAFFIIPMGGELGWSRGDMSWALTARLVVAGLSGPLLGSLVDRYGTRWLGAGAGLVAGASLIALSFVHSLPFLYLAFAVAGLSGFGGVAGALLTTVPVGKWFTHRRGAAMAVATVGIPLGVAVQIPAAQWLISTIGWRDAWLVFGLAVVILVVPGTVLVMRRLPEDHGLRPYGEDRLDIADLAATLKLVQSAAWTRAEVLRTPATWLLVAAFGLGGLAISGTLLYRPAFFHDLGVPDGRIAAGLALDPITVIFSGLAAGALAERIGVRLLGLFGCLGLGTSLLPAIFSTGQTESVVMHALIWGASGGAWLNLNNLIWVTYYGRSSLGAIQGVVMPLLLISNGLGGPIFGMLLGAGMDPRTLWWIAFAMLALSGVILFAVRPARRAGIVSAATPTRS